VAIDTVFSSPALTLLLELEQAALDAGGQLSIVITEAGKLRITPATILTPDRCDRIRAHRVGLKLLTQLTDEAVQQRTARFRACLRRQSGPIALSQLQYIVAPVRRGQCRSCGDAAGDPRDWCWRCQLAAQLARDGDLPLSWVPVSTPSEASLPGFIPDVDAEGTQRNASRS
jgi:hypothetical protein